MTKLLLITTFFLSATSCLKTPKAIITDEYIEVVKPGQIFGIVEVDPTSIDSIFGYPKEEKEIKAFTLLDRKNGKPLSNDATVKIFFSKPDKKYRWQIQPNPFVSNYIYADTIHLKPKTWYRLAIQNSAYYKYIYCNGVKGDYIIKEKPKLGAY